MEIYSVPANLAVSDSGFMFLSSTGETFTLNEIGQTIFKLIQQGNSLKEIEDKILFDYDINQPSLEKDLTDFIKQLLAYKLLEAK
jgi:hypothetical protein